MGHTTTVGRATFHDILLGSIFDSGADVLVCPVNCAGAMGKGLALAFHQRYSLLFGTYTEKVARGLIHVHRPNLVRVDGGQRVVLFATKRHWRSRSFLADIKSGLTFMASALGVLAQEGRPIGSIAIPALGCGLGGLDWARVRPLIVEAMAPLDITVMLYAPKEGDA